MKAEIRERSVGTRVTEREYEQLLELAAGKPLGEWVRDVLLAQIRRCPMEEAVMSEVLALRTIVLNAVARLGKVSGLEDAVFSDIVARADMQKLEKAKARLQEVA